MRKRVALILILITIGSVTSLFLGSMAYFRQVERGLAQSQLNLYSRSLSDTLERFEYLPKILAKDPIVYDALKQSDGSKANVRFEEFSQKAGLEAIYLLDRSGLVIAASNHAEEPTFLGKNYGFRPYFRTALNGGDGRFFGVGATTGRPGYFFAQPVSIDEIEVIGVLAVKLDMSEFQRSWEVSGDSVFATDSNDVVVLATNPEWLYQSIRTIAKDQIDALVDSRQFGNAKIEPLEWQLTDDEVTIAGDRYIHVSDKKQKLGWVVHFLQNEGRIWERASFATAIFGVAVVALVLMATFLRSIRIQQALQTAQADRARLQISNKELEKAHVELKRTGHLAALGRVAASVTHELGQPISALKNYLGAAEISGEFTRKDTLPKVERVIERVENIAKELRFFTQAQPALQNRIDLNHVVQNAIELTQHDLDQSNCELKLSLAQKPLNIHGNQFRLERVIINLIRNALEAMSENETRQLSITTGRKGNEICCCFEDTGPGLGQKTVEQLTEPFHTTKPSGTGMGLGLAIASQIVAEHKGNLLARNGRTTGAVFEVLLPMATKEEQSE